MKNRIFVADVLCRNYALFKNLNLLVEIRLVVTLQKLLNGSSFSPLLFLLNSSDLKSTKQGSIYTLQNGDVDSLAAAEGWNGHSDPFLLLFAKCSLMDEFYMKLFTGNTPDARRLRSSFCQLLEQVSSAASNNCLILCQMVSVAGNSVIYDGVLMDQLVALFVCMSGSKARALRYLRPIP